MKQPSHMKRPTTARSLCRLSTCLEWANAKTGAKGCDMAYCPKYSAKRRKEIDVISHGHVAFTLETAIGYDQCDDGNGWSLLYEWINGCMASLEYRHVVDAYKHSIDEEHYGFNE